MARETRLHPAELIAPLFVTAEKGAKEALASLSGQFRWGWGAVAEEARRLEGLGVGGVILFGVVAKKDAAASGAFDGKGPVPRALESVAKAAPGLVRMADVCLCEYADHGHCGVLAGDEVDNDATLPLLVKEGVTWAKAGADVVAPSAMMDGQVAAIRAGLDAAGLSSTAILAYSAKTASAFYGPFRDAAGSAPGKGDRKGYQMDFANADEAVREALLDVEEGADAVMVKPAGPNLDLVRDVAEAVDVPVAAYQTSGEYAALHAAADAGRLDLDRAVLETLTGIRRAGARWILTYFAAHAAEALKDGRWDRA